MSVVTTYDEIRQEVKKDLENIEEKIRTKLLDKTVWGYEDMRPEYIEEVEKIWLQIRKMPDEIISYNGSTSFITREDVEKNENKF